ncbi:hypothetical protein IJ798_00125 [Candidatus Saccharibacteria bacterium]|nr:hypothetical protein [Candidatus Saccharibacteria bacterium]
MEQLDIYKLEDAYDEIVALRECGLRSILTHIENLEYDMRKKYDYSPIEAVTSRTKSFRSAMSKCEIRGLQPCVETFREMHDVAGVRIITPFLDDVQRVRDALMVRDTLKVVTEKDYISNPKTSGYRSLHLICETRTALSEDYEWNIVEIQIRTILQNAWCSLEHRLRYKKQDLTNGIAFEWAQLGDLFYEKDQQMMRLRDQNRAKGISGAKTLELELPAEVIN